MNAYEHFLRHLRMQGCKCPLMWNGTICVPATICEQRPADSPDRRKCLVLAEVPPVPEAPADVQRLHDLDALQSAGGD